ncbi:MAG: hypothetical protein HY658_10405 [Actinobacteria bacterium]|nr:hypothetical protein [Actinomycetota bacterium]
MTVFGAGAMGTAMAIHAARLGLEAALWATPFDGRVLEAMRTTGSHPALPEHLPSSLSVHGPDELDRAADGCEVAVMAASSAGIRSLARMVGRAAAGAAAVISVTKGLERETLKRPSEVYAEEIPGPAVVAVAGPCLAPELAQQVPTAALWASSRVDDARRAGAVLDSPTYQVRYSDDVAGAELCAVTKNVAAIGMGIVDGMARIRQRELRNAKAALFATAVGEMAVLVERLGGRPETARGLAGIGDVLVTGLGGRNRLYGELVGTGEDPGATLARLTEQGLTVEGVEAARDVRVLAERVGADLPYHAAVHGVLFEGVPPEALLEVL